MRRLLPLLCALACLAVPVAAQRLPSRLKTPVAPPAPRADTPAPRPTPAAKAPSGPDQAVPFAPGESLTYDVSWSDMVTAGTATVTVRDRRRSQGATAWYVVAEGRPTPLLSKLYTLYYKADSLIDTRTLLPQRGSVFSQEGRRQRLKETRFEQAARRAVFHLRTRTTLEEEQRLPGATHDPLSAIYALRAMPLRRGARTAFAVADSGELYAVEATVTGHEVVETPAGRRTAWKIEPVIRDERGQPFGEGLALWISDDDRRVPVKLQAKLPVGSFVLTLTGH